MKQFGQCIKCLAPLIISAILIQSCSEKVEIEPPFFTSAGIAFHEVAKIKEGPSGMTGDMECFISWDLNASEQQIGLLTTNSQVHDKLYWLTGRTERFNKMMDYFDGFTNYRIFKPNIENMLKEPDLRYAYTELLVMTNGDVGFATMWICSPHAKKIAFLCGF